MATTELDTLLVKIAADTAQLRGELAKATSAMAKSMQSMAKESEKLNLALDRIAGKIKGALIGALSAVSVRSIANLARDTLQWADDTGTLAERLGVTTDELQALIFAGRELNVTSQQMAAGLVSFWAKVSEAGTGKGEALPVLKALGIDPKSLRDADQALAVIGAKLRDFDRQSQLSVAKTLFGDEKAAQFLALMIGDLEALKAKARELGVVVDASLIQKGTELNKEFEKVADVAMAKLRKEVLYLTQDVEGLVVAASKLPQWFKDAADNLLRVAPVIGPMIELRGAIDEARRDAEGQAALGRLGDARLRQLAGPQRPANTGTRRLNLDPAGASAAEQFEKQIQKMRTAALALQHELRFDKATAANVAALEAFATSAGKIKPSTEQVKQFSRALKDVEAGKTALAFKSIADENERLAQIVAAEVSGNRELVAVLEARFRLEDKLGQRLTEEEAARAAALAQTRFKIEETRQRSLEMQAAIGNALEGAAAQGLDAFGAFFDKNRDGWAEMRAVAVNALRAIAQEMLMITLIRPAAKAGSEWISSLLGLAGAAAGAAGGDIIGGGAGGFSIPLRAGGGPISGPAIVGERGPELFVPDTAGMIVPNGKKAGGTTYIDARGADKAALARVEAILRLQGQQIHRIDMSFEERAVAANIDARRRGMS